MSLSRPLKFPLLKLPWLCIKCVIQNSDLVDLIFFAPISNRTRSIVQHSKYPLKEIDVVPKTSCKRIYLGKGKYWYFTRDKYENAVPLVLKRNSEPILTGEFYVPDRGSSHTFVHSYTDGDELDALKMGIEFMIDVFGCAIRELSVDKKLSERSGLGISSVKTLRISDPGPVNITDLKYLLENTKVTDEHIFSVPISNDFYCDPQIFKCRGLSFLQNHSADWVTLEVLCQFNVAQIIFSYQRFSKEDIVSYITHWFNSENRNLEYVLFDFKNSSLEDFKIDHLNPMPFCEKRRSRWSLNESWKNEDMSSGIDIIRKDGLLATLFAYRSSIFFYVWHERFPDAVSHN